MRIYAHRWPSPTVCGKGWKKGQAAVHTVIFVPARYPSQRFPGKPLAMLTGATGEARSLIRRSWDAATSVDGIDAVYVLTDDDRIAVMPIEDCGGRIPRDDDNIETDSVEPASIRGCR